jgi:hypothetical protein
MATTNGPKKPRVSRAKYKGELAEPIYEPIGGVNAEVMRAAAEARARDSQVKKIEALLAWYEIDPAAPDAWIKLAVTLALAHVPGLKVVHDLKRSRGRKKTWRAGLGIELVRDVEAVLKAKPPRTTTADAIRFLMKDKTRIWKDHTEPNLLTRHREARKEEQRRQIMVKSLKASLVNIFGSLPARADGNQ